MEGQPLQLQSQSPTPIDPVKLKDLNKKIAFQERVQNK